MNKNLKEYKMMLEYLENDLVNNEITLEEFEQLAADYKVIFQIS